MTIVLVLPLGLSALFALIAPGASRRLPPRIASWLLSIGALVLALGSSASLALVAFGMLARTPLLAAQGRWSSAVLVHHGFGSGPAGVVACAAVTLLAARFLVIGSRQVHALLDSHRLAAELARHGGELAVLDVEERHAVAVPGRPGRIAVTSGLLRVLDAGERRALLAHERSHLAHRHHLHLALVRIAAAVNPLLSRLPAAAALSAERWADEDAASSNPRDVVAQALTLAGSRPVGPAAVLAAGAVDVADRIAALGQPPPRLSALRIAIPAALIIATAIAVAVALQDTERIFELAQTAYSAGRP